MQNQIQSLSGIFFSILLMIGHTYSQSFEADIIGGGHSWPLSTLGTSISFNLDQDYLINGVGLVSQFEPEFSLGTGGHQYPNQSFIELELYHRNTYVNTRIFDLTHQLGIGYQQLSIRGNHLETVDNQCGVMEMFCADDEYYQERVEHSPIISQSAKFRLHFPSYFGVYLTERVSLGLHGITFLTGIGLSFGSQ